MPTRNQSTRISDGNGGDLSTYAKFRDRLLLWLVGLVGALLIAGMSYFVHQSQLQTTQVRTDSQEQSLALRKEIGELRDRLNAELSSHAAFQAAQTTLTAEVIRRLNLLDNKMDQILVPVSLQPRR